MAGYLDWRQHGLVEPERVVQATAAYRAESDSVARFLDERCLAGHGTAGSTDLFKAWEKWCADQGEEPGTQKALATALENCGFDKFKDGSGRMRWLRPPADQALATTARHRHLPERRHPADERHPDGDLRRGVRRMPAAGKMHHRQGWPADDHPPA